MLGSPPYMAPEQWADPAAAGPLADLYALGIIAYEALTGRLPFDAEPDEACAAQHRDAPVPPLGDGFAPTLDRLFQRALAKRPEERFANALELAAALRAEVEAKLRAQIRASARQWHDRARPMELLWRGGVLADLERWIQRTGSGVLGALDLEFVEASRKQAARVAEATRRRAAWFRRGAVVFAALLVVSVLRVMQYRTRLQAELSVTAAEVEQGRQATLHDDPGEAVVHLTAAYRRGDHSPATKFMLSRALQPTLAERARFAAVTGRMWSGAFSPDGQRIVTTDDGGARVWDSTTSRLLLELPHGDTVYQAIFSSDGTRIVTAGRDSAVRIWDATTGALRHLLGAPAGTSPRYFVVAMSPDGHLVAAIDATGAAVRVWDAATGARVADLNNAASEWPTVAFSADGRWLATTGGNDVRVFDTGTWAPIATIGAPRVRGLAFDPHGPRLVTGTAEGDASIWELPSGARCHHLHEFGDPIDAVAFSPDGRLVATAAQDGAEQIWDAASGRLVSHRRRRSGKVHAIEFDPSSRLLLSADSEGIVVVSDIDGMVSAEFVGPSGPVRTAHFNASSSRIIGASWDGSAWVWDTTAPYRRWSSPTVADDCGIATSLRPDGRFLAIGCRSQPTRIWDTAHDELLAELPAVTPAGGDFAGAYPAVSVRGDRAAIARQDTVEVYALPGGRLVRTIAQGAPVSTVAFGPSGHELVTGGTDGSLLVTRDEGEPLALPRAGGGIDTAAILGDGRVIASDALRRLRIFSPTGEVLAALEQPMRAMLLRPTADGSALVTVPSFTAAVAPALWDLGRYRLIARLEGHVGQVRAARWTSGDRQILTAGGDGTARLWDGATGHALQTFHGGSRFLVDALFDPSGTLLVGGDGDGLLRFWDASNGRPLWILRAHKSHVVGVHFEGDAIITHGFGGEVARWSLPDPDDVIDAAAHVPGAR
jgi:WD40 repeat protein